MASQQPVGGALDAFAYFQFGFRAGPGDALDTVALPDVARHATSSSRSQSSLDVLLAIQMDMGKQLDFNHELITVGISNTLSGLLGGFTGSYIFSQTIFTFRTGSAA